MNEIYDDSTTKFWFAWLRLDCIGYMRVRVCAYSSPFCDCFKVLCPLSRWCCLDVMWITFFRWVFSSSQYYKKWVNAHTAHLKAQKIEWINKPKRYHQYEKGKKLMKYMNEYSCLKFQRYNASRSFRLALFQYLSTLNVNTFIVIRQAEAFYRIAYYFLWFGPEN